MAHVLLAVEKGVARKYLFSVEEREDADFKVRYDPFVNAHT